MRRTMLMLSAAGALLSTSIGASGHASEPAGSNADDCASKPTKFARDQCERFKNSAAGDEYFGRMKLSFLGINNTFRDEAIRAGAYTTDSGLINRLVYADEALNDWSKKHPYDPDLARSYFLAIQVYKKVYIRPYQEKAWSYMQIESSRFGTTYFGKIVKADIARGYTEHYFDNPVVCPTPLPAGVFPETTPNASPTPAPKKGQPKVALITPPCVPPMTPSPEPTSSPSPLTGSPAPSSSPGTPAMPSEAPSALPVPNPSPSATANPAPSAMASPSPAATESPSPTATASPSHRP